MMKGKPKYSISLLCHNQLEHTKKCIDSILKHSSDYELIISDNASTDGTIDYLKRFKKKIIGIFNADNIGFGAAHNQALKKASGRYFIVLNNDVEVCKGWLESLEAPFSDPMVMQTGIARECHSLNEHGKGYIGGSLDYVQASTMMINTAFAKFIGLFSQRYKGFYCEDADLSLRIRSMGFLIKLVDIPIIHSQAVSTYKSKENIDFLGFEVRNRQVFIENWLSYLRTKSFKRKILVKREGAIGDVIWLSPLISEMKRLNKEAEIDVYTAWPDLIGSHLGVSRCIVTNQPVNDYDYDEIFDLNYSYENNQRESILDAYKGVCNLDLAGYRETPSIFLTKEEKMEAYRLICNAGGWQYIQQKRVIVFHTGNTFWAGRNYPIEQWKPIIVKMKERGWFTIEIGGHMTDKSGLSDFSLIGQTNLRQVAAVMYHANLFIGIDSLGSNLAQAFDIPSVVLFGSIDPKTRLLKRGYFKGLWNEELNCRGCHQWQRPPLLVTKKCFRGAESEREIDKCIKSIEKGEILMAADEVVNSKRRAMEASKIRDKVVQYCVGKGVDIGCAEDKIKDDAIGIDFRELYGVDIIHDLNIPLPFKNCEFDYVFSSHCLEHLIDYQRALSEWTRILKVEGLMILYLPHIDYYTEYNPEHLHEFRNHDVTDFLQSLGFRIEVDELDVGENRYSFLVVARKFDLPQK